MKMLVFAMALLAVIPAQAFRVEEKLADPVGEARARDLFGKLRCVVCEGQSIADSDADLAYDLRAFVREQIKAGKSDRDILAYIVSRYGERMLLEPEISGGAYGLWAGPFLFLVAGAIIVLAYVRTTGRKA